MNRNTNREEALRIAAERRRQQKEKEEREENEFYERITSGNPWLIFKVIVAFCSLIALITTIDHFVDGPTKKLGENDWKINRDWEWTWHKIVEVEGSLFTPMLGDWSDRDENSVEVTYSPILRTVKKLNYNVQMDEVIIRKQEEIRWRSIFSWFPAFQILLLIPLLTFIFKRQKPWFNFARIASLFLIFPGTLLVLYYTLL